MWIVLKLTIIINNEPGKQFRNFEFRYSFQQSYISTKIKWVYALMDCLGKRCCLSDSDLIKTAECGEELLPPFSIPLFRNVFSRNERGTSIDGHHAGPSAGSWTSHTFEFMCAGFLTMYSFTVRQIIFQIPKTHIIP